MLAEGLYDLAEKMKADWDRRARSHAQFWVATGHHDNDASFTESGRRDAETILSALGPYRRDSWSVLEIGCGVGRLLRALSPRFAHLCGVDVSREMIRRSRRYLAGVPNVETREVSGTDLGGLAEARFDLVYAYVAFQHMPEDVVVRYLTEANRVLKADGCLLFQMYLGSPRLLSDHDTFTVRVYDPQALDQYLRDAGFNLVQYQLLGCDVPETENRLMLLRKSQDTSPIAETRLVRPATGSRYLSDAELNMYGALFAELLPTARPEQVMPMVEELARSLDGMLEQHQDHELACGFRRLLGQLRDKLTQCSVR